MPSLPIIKYHGKKYYRDDRLQQIRNVDNPHDFISFEDLTLPDLAGMHPDTPQEVKKKKTRRK